MAHLVTGMKFQYYTAQKMKFSIKDFFSKCDQIRRKLLIWSHLLKKSIMENNSSIQHSFSNIFSLSQTTIYAMMLI